MLLFQQDASNVSLQSLIDAGLRLQYPVSFRGAICLISFLPISSTVLKHMWRDSFRFKCYHLSSKASHPHIFQKHQYECFLLVTGSSDCIAPVYGCSKVPVLPNDGHNRWRTLDKPHQRFFRFKPAESTMPEILITCRKICLQCTDNNISRSPEQIYKNIFF
jgi:hypothetical protein